MGIRGAVAAAGFLAVAVYPTAGLPQQSNEDVLEELRQVEENLSTSRDRMEQKRNEAKSLAEELKHIRRRSIKAAERVQSREAELTHFEKKLDKLLTEENLVLDKLREHEDDLLAVLSALQAMERNRPPALLVRPNDAVNAARSAMLLGSILPDIYEKAEELNKSLRKLTTVREDIQSQRDDLRIAGQLFLEEQAQLKSLLEQKTRLQKAAQVAAAVEAARVANYAARARTLQEVVKRLGLSVTVTRPSAPSSGQEGQPAIRVAPKRLTEVKGALRAPVAGTIVTKFGNPRGSKKIEGLTIRTRAGAQVVAPFDSKVVFAQPYRNYGQVLILETADGYHFVLTGLDQIYSVVGQQLLAGEPVGSMGVGPARPQTVALTQADLQTTGPDLYFEMRKNGTPIDPLPWLAAPQQKG